MSASINLPHVCSTLFSHSGGRKIGGIEQVPSCGSFCTSVFIVFFFMIERKENKEKTTRETEKKGEEKREVFRMQSRFFQDSKNRELRQRT